MSVNAFVCCCSRIINLDRGLVDTFLEWRSCVVRWSSGSSMLE